MKLHRHAFETYWSAHAWAGVLVALAVNAIFFTGVFALFRDETLAWQDPRAHALAPCDGVELEPLLQAALERSGITPSALEIAALDVRCAPVSVRAQGVDGAGAPADQTWLVDRRRAEVLETRSVLANFLFYVHFFYEPEVLGLTGMWVAGVLGVLLLLILASGVLIHLKDFTRQLHQLRAVKKPRVLWSDVHKVMGVMGIPFQTLMVLTGSIVCLATPVMGLFSQVVFDGDVGAARGAFFERFGPPAPSGAPASRLSADALLERAREAVPGLEPRYIRLRHVGDAAAHAVLAGRVPVVFGDGEVTLSAVDGEVLGMTVPGEERAIRATQRWIYGFHFAWYGGLPLRLLYALLGLAGCVTILSGNWIWLERRDPTRERRSSRVLGRLTVGGGLGVAVAVAAMFFVNRAVPIELAWHQHAEVGAFVIGWLLALVGAWLPRSEVRAASLVLGTAGALFAVTPLLSFGRTPLHLVGAVAHGAHDIALVDALLLVFGAAAIAGADWLRRVRA